jgi:hypothetical protein
MTSPPSVVMDGPEPAAAGLRLLTASATAARAGRAKELIRLPRRCGFLTGRPWSSGARGPVVDRTLFNTFSFSRRNLIPPGHRYPLEVSPPALAPSLTVRSLGRGQQDKTTIGRQGRRPHREPLPIFEPPFPILECVGGSGPSWWQASSRHGQTQGVVGTPVGRAENPSAGPASPCTTRSALRTAATGPTPARTRAAAHPKASPSPPPAAPPPRRCDRAARRMRCCWPRRRWCRCPRPTGAPTD